MNTLRRISLSRLLLLCGLVLVIGVFATAVAFALGNGPTPPPKQLPEAVHDALSAPQVQGLSARIELTNHLLEGASLAGSAGAGQLGSNPLLSGASGRLWIAKDGRARLELQAESGDTQVLYDGSTLEVYDASSNTLYRYAPPAGESGGSGDTGSPGSDQSGQREVPSVAKIEEAISNLRQHAGVSGAIPTDVAGQPAYTVRVSPKEGGSLLGGAELSFDADNGVPLRAAVYSSQSSAPVIELAASEVSFGPVDSSVFAFSPPADAKVEDVHFSDAGAAGPSAGSPTDRPNITTHGHGPSTIAVLEGKAKPEGGSEGEQLGSLPKVTINGTSANELRTELGTLLTFERSGIRYVVAGALPPTAIEEVARGL